VIWGGMGWRWASAEERTGRSGRWWRWRGGWQCCCTGCGWVGRSMNRCGMRGWRKRERRSRQRRKAGKREWQRGSKRRRKEGKGGAGDGNRKWDQGMDDRNGRESAEWTALANHPTPCSGDCDLRLGPERETAAEMGIENETRECDDLNGRESPWVNRDCEPPQRLVRETAICVLALKRETAAEMAAPQQLQSAAGKWRTGGPAGPQQAPSAEPLARVRIEARRRRGGGKAASAWRDPEEQEMSVNLVEEGRVSQCSAGWWKEWRTPSPAAMKTPVWDDEEGLRQKKGAAGRKGASVKWWDSVPPPPGIYRIGADRQVWKQAGGRRRLPVRTLAALGSHPCVALSSAVGTVSVAEGEGLVFGLSVEPQSGVMVAVTRRNEWCQTAADVGGIRKRKNRWRKETAHGSGVFTASRRSAGKVRRRSEKKDWWAATSALTFKTFS